MKLSEDLTLPTAARYSRPGDPGAKLPLVLGDFVSEDGVTPTSQGGITPTVLINKDELVYLINDARSDPTTLPMVYLNGVLQDNSVFTYDPSSDYESLGHLVAIIQFSLTAVLSGEITVRMRGAVNETGQLITNPIEAIQYAFTTKGNWTSTDFDAISCNQAQAQAYAFGLPVHWALVDDRTYKQHLTDVLYHYHGNHTLNRHSQLVITLDQAQFVPSEQILVHLDAQRDVAGVDPEDAIEWDLDKRNVANSLEVFYQYSWVTNDYLAKLPAPITARASITFYGVQKRTVRLPGIRSYHHLSHWVNLFLTRYSIAPAIVRFRLRTLAYLALLPGTYCTLTWAWGPSSQGTGWSKRILKVLNTVIDYRRHEIELECFDTGMHFILPNYLAMLDTAGIPRFLRVLPDGAPEILTYPPGEVAMLATPMTWIRRESPAETTWYIYVDDNGVFVTSTTQPSGTGTALPLTFIDRFSGAWRLQIIDEFGTYQFVKG